MLIKHKDLVCALHGLSPRSFKVKFLKEIPLACHAERKSQVEKPGAVEWKLTNAKASSWAEHMSRRINLMRRHVKTGEKSRPQWYKLLFSERKTQVVGDGSDKGDGYPDDETMVGSNDEAGSAEDAESEASEHDSVDEPGKTLGGNAVKDGSAVGVAGKSSVDGSKLRLCAKSSVGNDSELFWFGYDRVHRRAWRQRKAATLHQAAGAKLKETTQLFRYADDAEPTDIVEAEWPDGQTWLVKGLTVEEYLAAEDDGKVKRHMPSKGEKKNQKGRRKRRFGLAKARNTEKCGWHGVAAEASSYRCGLAEAKSAS